MEKLVSIKELFAKSFEIYTDKFWTIAGLMTINLLSLLITLLFNLILKPYAADIELGIIFVFLNALIFSAGIMMVFLAVRWKNAHRRFWVSLLKILVAVIGFIFSIFVLLQSFLIGIHSIDSIDFIGFILTFLSSLLIFLLIIKLWTFIAFLIAIKNREADLSLKQLLNLGWPKLLSYIWIFSLVSLTVFVGFILFIIPGIIFSIWFSLSLYVFVFEDIRGIQTLWRSKELIKGYWWSVFGRLFIFGVIAGLIGVVPFFGPLINIFFTMPFGIIYGYFIYQDLKFKYNKKALENLRK